MWSMRRRLSTKSYHQHLGMSRFQTITIAVFFMLCSVSSQSQAISKVLSGEKTEYAINDEFTIQFNLKVDPKTCKDGMEKTAIFSSGLKIINQSEWIELQKGLWQITMKCLVTGNRKNLGQLTVMRKTDKQDLFEQVKFNIRKDVDLSK